MFEEDKKEFMCPGCGKIFERKWNFDRHMSKKNGCLSNNESKYKCQHCGKFFSKQFNLTAHLNKKNPCVENSMFEKMSGMIKQQQEVCETLMEKIGTVTTIPQTQNLTKTDHLDNTNTTNNSQTVTNSNNTQNITNNQTNSNNTMHNMSNSYLIQYVINQYPNAKNIEDCIKLENIPKMTLSECEDLYFTDGAMKIFKGLCDLGEENRPIHCTDASRCNYIYKSNDVWKIDVGGEAIRNHFFPVIQEAYTQVHKNRIKDNPGNSTIIGNYLTEMTGTNVKKICQKTLKKLSNDFLAKNSKNAKLIANQVKRIEA
jgi:uncharacterized C2H2 Zn-finger protein